MRRREFIKVDWKWLVAWPLTAVRAQQSERVPTIGVLQSQAVDDAERQGRTLRRFGRSWNDGLGRRPQYSN